MTHTARKYPTAVVLGVLMVFSPDARADATAPIDVDIWDPPFNQGLLRVSGTYERLSGAKKQWRVCVSIPHLKDPYWAAVNFAMIDEARRLGVAVRLLEAGGYANLKVQRKQIGDCMASGGEALIVSAISATGLNDMVEDLTSAGKPVIDMINGMTFSSATPRCAVDFYDAGHAAGTYIRQQHEADPKRIKVAWFPGPEGALWVDQGDKGFRAALAGSAIEIVASTRGDTGKSVQTGLVADALNKHADLDYVIGTTVSANAAVGLLRRRKQTDQTKVLAYYYGPGVHRGISRGSILAAPTDLQALQARMSLDLAIRALEGSPVPQAHRAEGQFDRQIINWRF